MHELNECTNIQNRHKNVTYSPWTIYFRISKEAEDGDKNKNYINKKIVRDFEKLQDNWSLNFTTRLKNYNGHRQSSERNGLTYKSARKREDY